MENNPGKKDIIFSDMDGTLIFHTKAHKVEEVGNNGDGTVSVLDPKTARVHRAYDCSTDKYKTYIGTDTLELGQGLHRDHDMVIVSGARKNTMDGRKILLNFFDAAILENGALVLDRDYNPDAEWQARIAPEMPALEEAKKQLDSLGWKMDNGGRTAMIRVRRAEDNPHKSDAEYEHLKNELVLPEGIKKTSNLKFLDIIPESAGKGNAVRYLMGKMGHTKSESIGIGDDDNDLEMLAETGRNYVLGSAFPKVIETARKQGWYVSKGVHFDGINEILRHIRAPNEH